MPTGMKIVIPVDKDAVTVQSKECVSICILLMQSVPTVRSRKYKKLLAR